MNFPTESTSDFVLVLVEKLAGNGAIFSLVNSGTNNAPFPKMPKGRCQNFYVPAIAYSATGGEEAKQKKHFEVKNRVLKRKSENPILTLLLPF